MIAIQFLAALVVYGQSTPFPTRERIEEAARSCEFPRESLAFGHDEMGDFADLADNSPTTPSRSAIVCMMQWAIEHGARFGMFLEPNKRPIATGPTSEIATLAAGARTCGLNSHGDTLDRQTTMLLIRRHQAPATLDCLRRWVAANPLPTVRYEPLD